MDHGGEALICFIGSHGDAFEFLELSEEVFDQMALTCPPVFGPSIGRMKKSRYTEEQIVGILRETDRDPVATVAKRHGVSEQAIYTWKKRFGSFQPDDVRRLKQLEQENGRLKKLVAERDLEIEVMKEIAAKKW